MREELELGVGEALDTVADLCFFAGDGPGSLGSELIMESGSGDDCEGAFRTETGVAINICGSLASDEVWRSDGAVACVR